MPWWSGFLLLACSHGAAVTSAQPFTAQNPSGSCQAPDDGSRAGYHSAAGLQWVKDCQSPLAREYWRVFAVDAAHAATIPRLDGDPALRTACEDAGDALAPLVQRYGLCAAASSEAQLEKVNKMAIDDALTLTRTLHRQLRFEYFEPQANERRAGLQPFPIPSDVIDACNLHSNEEKPELAALCVREKQRLDSGDDLGLRYEGEGARQLALRLNELYGIPLD